MADFADILLPAFAACLILTGIHAYLGLHVVERGVIFVDLALAQVAALGTALAFLIGFHVDSLESYLISLGATLFGALLLALSRLRRSVVTQEAVIGIVYVVAAAAMVLLLAQTPEGGEELKALLVGHLLFVSWNDLLIVFLLYLALGFLHWLYRRQVFAITRDPEKARQDGLKVRSWDFFFYATFGVVVTSSVKLAGILLVFSFLVIPAVCAFLLVRSTAKRLTLGWFIGLLASMLGVWASYVLDLPTGATVVCAFGLMFLLCLLISRISVPR